MKYCVYIYIYIYEGGGSQVRVTGVYLVMAIPQEFGTADISKRWVRVPRGSTGIRNTKIISALRICSCFQVFYTAFLRKLTGIQGICGWGGEGIQNTCHAFSQARGPGTLSKFFY